MVPRKAGRPLKGALKEVDEVLKEWGDEAVQDFAGDHLGWPKEALLSKVIREGPDAAAQPRGQQPPISDRILAVDNAVRLVAPVAIKKTLYAWYTGNTKQNRTLCFRKLRIKASELNWRLMIGRQAVAEMLGLDTNITQ